MSEDTKIIITARINRPLIEGALDDLRVRYSRDTFIRPDLIEVIWGWDHKEHQWEISKITVFGFKVKKTGKVGIVGDKTSWYVGHRSGDEIPDSVLEQAEQVRPHLTA